MIVPPERQDSAGWRSDIRLFFAMIECRVMARRPDIKRQEDFMRQAATGKTTGRVRSC